MTKEITIQDIMTEQVTVANVSNTFSQVMDFFSLFNQPLYPLAFFGTK